MCGERSWCGVFFVHPKHNELKSGKISILAGQCCGVTMNFSFYSLIQQFFITVSESDISLSHTPRFTIFCIKFQKMLILVFKVIVQPPKHTLGGCMIISSKTKINV